MLLLKIEKINKKSHQNVFRYARVQSNDTNIHFGEKQKKIRNINKKKNQQVVAVINSNSRNNKKAAAIFAKRQE